MCLNALHTTKLAVAAKTIITTAAAATKSSQQNNKNTNNNVQSSSQSLGTNERTYECRLLTALSPLKSIKQIIAAAAANNSQPTNSQQLPNEASRTKRDYLLCYITHNTHSVLSTPSTPFTRSLTQSLNSTTTTSKDDVSLFKYAQPSKSTRYNNRHEKPKQNRQ